MGRISELQKRLADTPCVDSRTRVRELKREISAFEEKHAMKTQTMLDKLCSGELSDKGVYAKWRRAYMTLRGHQAHVRSMA